LLLVDAAGHFYVPDDVTVRIAKHQVRDALDFEVGSSEAMVRDESRLVDHRCASCEGIQGRGYALFPRKRLDVGVFAEGD
jgi:hypothetical protein